MSSDPLGAVLFPLDTGNLFAEEFLLHPDFRVIAGFLLGWVFWSGISHACRSQFFQLLGHICWNFVRRPRSTQTDSSDIEAQASQHNVEKKSQRRFSQLSALHRISNDAALTFTLNLCFAFAGFAYFCSLLVYDPNGDTACAFTVAWASMAAQATRLIGLVMLMLRLHRRGVSNLEFYSLCAALAVGLSFVLAYTATNTGGIVPVQTLNLFLCNRVPYVPTAVLSSVGFIVLELYMAFRFLGWAAYKTSFRAMLAKSANLQVARACSLLLLDVLTVVPNASITNQLAQFIPLSVGALIVIGVFNRCVSDRPVSSTAVPMPPAHAPRSPSLPPIPQPTRRPPTMEGVTSPVHSPRPQDQDDSVPVLDSPPPPIGRATERQPISVPSSAPPRIGDAPVFAEHQSRQILPFQVQYAERLERHVHTGPIAMPLRTKRQRPHVQVVIEDMEPPERSSVVPPSVIGSDILRMPSAATTRSTKWSPDSNTTPSDYTVSRSSSAATPTTTTRTPTTTRDSTLSMFTTGAPSRSLSAGSRTVLSAASRQPSRRKIRSPGEASLKLPWRSVARSSFTSNRTFGAREELPVVVEGRADGSSRRASHTSAAAKRMVISRPQSLRASRPSSLQPPRVGKQLPSIPSNSRRSSPHLMVPEHRNSPIGLPESPASSIRPSSEYIVRTPPAPSPKLPSPKPPSPVPPPISVAMPTSPPVSAYERVQGSGRLRGPRSPPMSSSVPNLISGWPVTELGIREERRRSGSCPELPPLDLGMTGL